MRPYIEKQTRPYSFIYSTALRGANLILSPATSCLAWLKSIYMPKPNFYSYKDQKKFETELDLLRSKYPRQY